MLFFRYILFSVEARFRHQNFTNIQWQQNRMVNFFQHCFLNFSPPLSSSPSTFPFIPHLNYKKKITKFSIEIYWMGKITNFSLVLPTVPVVLWSERENLYVLKLNLCTRKIHIFLFVWGRVGIYWPIQVTLFHLSKPKTTTTTKPEHFLFVENLGLGEN